MPFSKTTAFDSATLAVMSEAYEAALADLMRTPEASRTPEQTVALGQLATRISEAAEEGERDVERLKSRALGFTMTLR